MRRIALGGLLLLLMVTVAAAGTVTADWTGFQGGSIGRNIGSSGSAGVFEFRLISDADNSLPFDESPDDGDFIGFCIELNEYISSMTAYDPRVYDVRLAQYAPVNNPPYYQMMGTEGQNALEILFASDYYLGDELENWNGMNLQARAFQLAVWEIVYENAIAAYYSTPVAGSYSVSASSGYFWGTDAALVAEANTYLAVVNGAKYTQTAHNAIRALVLTGGQDYIVRVDDSDFYVDEVVPLPPAALMGIGLLGVLGVARRFRRHASR